MDVAMIIDIAFFACLGLSILIGMWKGLYKTTFGLCFNIVLFLIIWLIIPAFAGVVVNALPEDIKMEIREYMTDNDLKNIAAGVIRIFASGVVWIALRIILKPAKIALSIVFKNIILGREKREKTWASRLGGGAVCCANCFLTFLIVASPVAGAMSTLKDEKGEIQCISSDGFNSCDYTKYYTDSSFSKVISVADLDQKTFKAMSNIKVFGTKVNLQEDLKSTFKVYQELEKKGLSFGDEIDYMSIFSKFTPEEIKQLGKTISSVGLLVSVLDKVGLKLIEKGLDLENGTLKNVKIGEEIENLFNIVGEMVKLPIFEGTEITSNYYNVLANLDTEVINGLVDSIKKSNLINELYDSYLVPKFDEMIEDMIKDLGGNKAVTINTDGMNFSSELHSMLTALSKIKDTGIVTLNATTSKYEISGSGTDVLKFVDEAKMHEMIDSLFDSNLISQVIGSVAEPFILKYFNETLDKNYTSEDLELSSISWLSELKNVASLSILLSKEGIIDSIKNNEDLLKSVLSPSKEKVSLIGEKMGKSKIITSLVPEIVEPTLEDTLSSMMSSGTVTLPDDVNWENEMKALLVAAKVFYDGNAFESNFDINEFIANLEVSAEKDEVQELSDVIVASEVFMTIFPDIIESQINNIDANVTYDDIVWEEEIESLLRAYKMLSSEGFFEDGADTTNLMLDILKSEANIDVLLASNIVYKVVTNRINTELETFEFDGEVLVTGSTAEFTKSDWKNEIKLLVDALDNQDSAADFANIGKMDPSLSDTTTRINNLSVIVSNLLRSKTLGPSVTDKVNELLELDGADKKTQQQLTDGVNWSVELGAANTLLWNITDDVNHETQKDVTIEMIPSFIDSAKATVVVKDLVETKIKNGLSTIKAEDNTPLFTETFINNLDIFDDNNDGKVNWNDEVDVKEKFDGIHYPGEIGYNNGDNGDGDKLTAAMTASGNTVVVRYIVEDKLLTEILERVKPYFFEDVNNPTAAETADYNAYVEDLDIFNANYRKEFNVYDKLQEFDVVSNDSSEFGPKLDELKLILEDSTIFGPVAEREIKSRLKDVLVNVDIDSDPNTVTNVAFVDDLSIYQINWTNELAIKDDLDAKLPLSDNISITTASDVEELFGTNGLFTRIANSVIVVGIINSNNIPDAKKIEITNAYIYNTIINEIDSMSAPNEGKQALKKIVRLGV